MQQVLHFDRTDFVRIKFFIKKCQATVLDIKITVLKGNHETIFSWGTFGEQSLQAFILKELRVALLGSNPPLPTTKRTYQRVCPFCVWLRCRGEAYIISKVSGKRLISWCLK